MRRFGASAATAKRVSDEFIAELKLKMRSRFISLGLGAALGDDNLLNRFLSALHPHARQEK